MIDFLTPASLNAPAKKSIFLIIKRFQLYNSVGNSLVN